MPHRRRWIAALLSCAIVSGSPRSSPGEIIPAARYPDAQLNDVCLLDNRLAWAVGDRGTILHSADGGETWQPQTSSAEPPFDGPLTSVHFIDALRGWAVGGRTRPHTLGSVGVVLTTTDGGRTWHELPARNLPALARVKFFDASRGIAIGRASSMQPSGVFVTEDGGRTWAAAPGGRGWSWRTGDFVDPLTGAVAGRGLWAAVDRRTLKAPPDEPPRIRAIRDLALVGPVGGWAAGDGGLVLTTSDLGRTWFEPDGLLPEYAARHFDLAAVDVHGDHVWALGTPGSRVFHSSDRGRSWQVFSTGMTTPLTAVDFADATHGIAVGALGTILVTHDGGRSWRPARQAPDRTPLFAVAARDEATPVEALVQSAADEGYLAATCVLFREPLEDVASRPAPHAVVTSSGDDREARGREAALLAGGSASGRAWRFPVPREVDDVLVELDRATDGRGLAQLESYLVRQIRMWRPDVIVVGTSPDGPAQEDELTRRAVLAAVEAAADPTQHIELAAEADLSAWQVKRVFMVAADAGDAHVTIAASSFISQLGSTVGEVAGEARGVLATPEAPGIVPLKQLFPQRDSTVRLRHVFDGIELPSGGGGRRAPPALSDEQVEQAAAAAKKRRNVQAILADSPGNAGLASHVAAFTEGLGEASTARVLYQLADGYRSAGRWDLAALALERLVREHPDDRLVDAALVWLVQYHAGGETKWGEKSAIGVRGSVRTGQGGSGGASEGDKPVEIARLAAEIRPQLVLEPQIGVPMAAAYRRAGLAHEADRYMLLLRQRGAADAWQRLAEAERWLATPSEHPPQLPIWTCRRTAERPHLDGVLDEAFWQSARPAVVRLHDQSASDQMQTSDTRQANLKLAYDGEFLYLAVQAPSDSRGEKQPSRDFGPRVRDEDLRGRDRVHLALDVDRDLTTYYELTMSDRGRVQDAAWHDPRWNPKWYVAHAADAEAWTIEAAIPLSEIAKPAPRSRDVWCIHAVHLSADGRAASWHGPAASEPSPASFGLLIFE